MLRHGTVLLPLWRDDRSCSRGEPAWKGEGPSYDVKILRHIFHDHPAVRVQGTPCDRVLFRHRRQASHPHVRHRMSCMAAPFPPVTRMATSFLGPIVAVPSTVPTLTPLETTTAFKQIRNRHRTDLPSYPFLTLPTGTLSHLTYPFPLIQPAGILFHLTGLSPLFII